VIRDLLKRALGQLSAMGVLYPQRAHNALMRSAIRQEIERIEPFDEKEARAKHDALQSTTIERSFALSSGSTASTCRLSEPIQRWEDSCGNFIGNSTDRETSAQAERAGSVLKCGLALGMR
jgi:hypothetical protein